MYRSVSLQIIQARYSKEYQNPSLSHALAALTMHSIPSTPISQDMVHVQKRSGSIASIITTETGSSSGETQNHLDASGGAIPPHSKQALLAHQQQHQYASTVPAPSSSSTNKKAESSNSKDSKKDENIDMFCEIWFAGEILGRTAVRHLDANTIWEDTFHFT